MGADKSSRYVANFINNAPEKFVEERFGEKMLTWLTLGSYLIGIQNEGRKVLQRILQIGVMRRKNLLDIRVALGGLRPKVQV